MEHYFLAPLKTELAGPVVTDPQGQPVAVTQADLYAYFKGQHEQLASVSATVGKLTTALAAVSQSVSALTPTAQLALANANLSLANDAALSTRLAAAEARLTLQEQALAANALSDAALAERVRLEQQQQAALAAKQQGDEVALVLAQQAVGFAKAAADAAQARADAAWSKADAAAAAAQLADAKAAAAAAKVDALTLRVTANETAIAALQARATTDEALLAAAQKKADDAAAAAAAADAKAVAAQGAVLALQYLESFVERSFRNVGATAVGATMPTGQAAQVTDPVAGRSGQVLVLDQVPYAFSVNPTVAATLVLVAGYPNGTTQDVLTKVVALTGLPAVGTVVDMLLGQPRLAIALPCTLTWKATSGTLSGKVFGHIEAP